MTHRTPWSALPPEVVQAIEAELGEPIIGVREAAEGFSSTLAATVALADDTRYFVKAATAEPGDRVGIMLEREVHVARQLPPSVPTPSLELELV
jgi:hypothetical protein